MTERKRLAFALGIGVALIAAGALNAAATASRHLVAVLVPRSLLTPGTVLDPKTVTVRALDVADIAPGTILAGRLSPHMVAAETLYPGEPLLAAQVVSEQHTPTEVRASALVPSGYLSVPLVLPVAAIGSPWPAPGEQVGFLGSLSSSGGVSVLTLNARITSISRVTSPSGPEGALQVMASQTSALKLENAAKNGLIALVRAGKGSSQ